MSQPIGDALISDEARTAINEALHLVQPGMQIGPNQRERFVRKLLAAEKFDAKQIDALMRGRRLHFETKKVDA